MADLEADTITFQLPKDFWKEYKIRAGTAEISIGGCIVKSKWPEDLRIQEHPKDK